MSPTVLKYKNDRFFFFSSRRNACRYMWPFDEHSSCYGIAIGLTSPHEGGEILDRAQLALEYNYRFSPRELREPQKIVDREFI